MTLEQYIDNINAKYKLGNATEHTFRGLLEQLIESIVPEIRATNEPKRQQCGAPDYILTKKDNLSGDSGIPVGFIEAKDIGDKDLSGIKKTGNKEQFDRYKASLNNLIFTDYLDFHLYIDGIFITKVAIAEIQDGKSIKPLVENFATFTNLIKDFCSTVSQTIKSPQKLAQMMAGKARLLSDVIELSLLSDVDNSQDSTLKDQMTAFKEILIHDITPKGFADVYAQTIAYGLFAARLHDPTLPTFSRQEAAELIPKSNPFLRKLFGYIAGPDIDDRIKWIVDSLVEIFLACDVANILKNYGKATKMEDPIIHFYETFLSEYDPKLRKARGVWYTPKPVVNFIIRAVDDILKTEFDLPQGLADTSKITREHAPLSLQKHAPLSLHKHAPLSLHKEAPLSLQKQAPLSLHRVQILDPATGTGTFLAEVVKHIHAKFKGQQGVWSNYVETHLLPRLNGFELLMASYAMAHLQMDLLLTETGYNPSPQTPEGGIKTKQRLKIYLTNSLEESHPDTGTLFANWLSSEANEANYIKRDTPVMCIVGNPPYSVSSNNKGKWIESLTVVYKKDLNERNIQPLSDDYIKFIRFAQHLIDKNGTGVLAYISNNSFIDGIIHRQMRKNLLESFDKIYILDLHGNARKQEVCFDGSADNNVFDIMQGVSINIFVKTGNKKKNELGQVFQFDLQGKRDFKYDFLCESSVQSITWNKLECEKPNYFFVKKNNGDLKLFESFIDLRLLFVENSMGIATGKDEELVSFDKSVIENKYSKASKFYYRPFDIRYTIFDNSILQRARYKLMNNYVVGKNLGLNIVRQSKLKGLEVLISNNLTNRDFITNHTYNFPLYLYPETNGQLPTAATMEHAPLPERIPNLNLDIVNKIAIGLGLNFTPEPMQTNHAHVQTNHAHVQTRHAHVQTNHAHVQTRHALSLQKTNFAPIDILDYIYAVLHSPNYREKYKEFLKIDFPKIPYPSPQTPEEGIESVQEKFWKLVSLGSQIREIHLLESPKVEDYITQFNVDGDCVVGKIYFEKTNETHGKVYLNYDKTPPSGAVGLQHFENVPEVAWHFYIGGYQPAQKWLKDRKGRKLEFDDILHYQKIIVALTETDRIMKEINEIEIF
jgi:Type ISP C-terminal specificity domain